MAAIMNGEVQERYVDEAVKRMYRYRFRLGMFDDPEGQPYTKIGGKVIGSKVCVYVCSCDVFFLVSLSLTHTRSFTHTHTHTLCLSLSLIGA